MALVELPKPAEFLELRNGEIHEIKPLEFEEGLMQITPRPPNPAIPKMINILRLWYDKDPSIPGLDYIDISSQTLIAQLAPMIDQVIKKKQALRIQAFGEGVKKRFTVSVI